MDSELNILLSGNFGSIWFYQTSFVFLVQGKYPTHVTQKYTEPGYKVSALDQDTPALHLIKIHKIHLIKITKLTTFCWG